ncbi:MAG: hypothetical protein N2110_06220 [Flavobacteriales bacterium]|nr:hypothetical protein [Flavobacteriales bacterium]MCX7768599.1 hypothetical protein [Flavobacteriales bacterium]MDW8409747.1 hypothetical protein [Flavobacteriales bacterium]
MKLKIFLSKFLFPILLGLFGLAMCVVALNRGRPQTPLFLVASLALVIASVIMILLALEKISVRHATILGVIFIVGSIFLAYSNYSSIQNDIRYEKEWRYRYEKVKQRLEKIREAQLAYREVNGKYCNNFEDLIHFLRTANIRVVMKIGDDEDTLAMLSKDKSRWRRDTVWRPVLGNKFKPADYPLDSLRYVPFGDTSRFVINAGFIGTEEEKMPVFETYAHFKVFLSDLAEKYDKQIPDSVIRVGSMVEPTTNGNWK